MARTITQAKRLQKKSRSHQVEHLYGGVYRVTSGTSGQLYVVRFLTIDQQEGASCSCPWGAFKPWADIRSACSHVQAVYNWLEGQHEPGRVVSAWTDPDQADRQKRPSLEIGDGVIITSRVKDW